MDSVEFYAKCNNDQVVTGTFHEFLVAASKHKYMNQ